MDQTHLGCAMECAVDFEPYIKTGHALLRRTKDSSSVEMMLKHYEEAIREQYEGIRQPSNAAKRLLVPTTLLSEQLCIEQVETIFDDDSSSSISLAIPWNKPPMFKSIVEASSSQRPTIKLKPAKSDPVKSTVSDSSSSISLAIPWNKPPIFKSIVEASSSQRPTIKLKPAKSDPVISTVSDSSSSISLAIPWNKPPIFKSIIEASSSQRPTIKLKPAKSDPVISTVSDSSSSISLAIPWNKPPIFKSIVEASSSQRPTIKLKPAKSDPVISTVSDSFSSDSDSDSGRICKYNCIKIGNPLEDLVMCLKCYYVSHRCCATPPITDINPWFAWFCSRCKQKDSQKSDSSRSSIKESNKSYSIGTSGSKWKNRLAVNYFKAIKQD